MHESREYPTRPIVGVGAAIWKDGQVLLVRQIKPPRDKLWGLPGGAQELGETVEAALAREIGEETGLEVTVGQLIDFVDAVNEDDSGRIRFHYTLLDFRCEWKSGDPQADSDVEEAMWYTLEDLDDLPMWEETRVIIRKSAEMA